MISRKTGKSMNQIELKKYLRAHRLHDAWWVRVDGIVDRDTVKIATLMTRKKRYCGKDVQVLHASLDYTDDTNWISLEYADAKSDELLKLNKHHSTSANDSRESQTVVHEPEDVEDVEDDEDVDHMQSLTAEVIEVRRTLNQWQCMMSEMMHKINELNDLVQTNMCTLNDSEHGIALDERESELAVWERELARRERYIAKCENKLIDLTYEQEETAVELALLSEGKNIPR